MPSLYKSPGVHIESAGDRYVPLEAVETGVTAFLGVTLQGPRQQPVRIGSFEQFEKVFGDDQGFFSADLSYLQEFYRQINESGTANVSAKCPGCGQEFQVDIGSGATALGES